MGGIAAIARAAGHRVTGSDRNVYPPMSTQLEAMGIDVIQGFEADQLEPAPDVVVVGNVMTRGQPVIEALLELGIPYASGPEWLSREVLKDRWVIAVAGTHGKTTTTSARASDASPSSSLRRTSTTPRFSTSAPSSCITGRAPRFSTISNMTTRTSIRMSSRFSGNSIIWCESFLAAAESSGMLLTRASRRL
jgi:hypothetical protein